MSLKMSFFLYDVEHVDISV